MWSAPISFLRATRTFFLTQGIDSGRVVGAAIWLQQRQNGSERTYDADPNTVVGVLDALNEPNLIQLGPGLVHVPAKEFCMRWLPGQDKWTYVKEGSEAPGDYIFKAREVRINNE